MLAARPLRILVVDDDPAMVGAITALVGTEGHQVITAYDGLTAQAQRYADLLREDGVDVTVHDVDGVLHGYLNMVGILDAACMTW